MDPIKERPKSVTTLKQEPFRQNLTDLPSKEKCREKKERKKTQKTNCSSKQFNKDSVKLFFNTGVVIFMPSSA